MKRTAEDIVIDSTVIIILSFFVILMIFPFLNILAVSLNNAADSLKGGITIYPREFTFANYKAVFSTDNISNAYGVTIFRTVVGTMLSLFFNAITAYALSKKLKIRRPLLAFLVFTMLFSGGIVPTYMLYRQLGILNKLWVYVIPGIYSVFNLLIFRTFFEGIPAEMEESAKLDGASELRTLWNIILPLSGPVFATLALFVGIGHWNDWFVGEFFIHSVKLQTLQNYLLKILQENASANTMEKYRQVSKGTNATQVSPESIRMAVLMIATIPIMCVYPFLQKHFVKGVLIGAVKG